MSRPGNPSATIAIRNRALKGSVPRLAKDVFNPTESLDMTNKLQKSRL
jgi:hypothetical protein